MSPKSSSSSPLSLREQIEQVLDLQRQDRDFPSYDATQRLAHDVARLTLDAVEAEMRDLHGGPNLHLGDEVILKKLRAQLPSPTAEPTP